MTYEQLDFIADSYIPLLMCVSMMSIALDGWKQGAKVMLTQSAAIILSIAIIYTVMFADLKWSIWASFTMDYSTHTALALCFVSFLACRNRRWRVFATGSMLAYCALMLHQNYHTVADMITTTLVVLPIILLVQLKRVSQRV